jgi:Cyclin M transmembrane N-terminal domain
LAAWRLRDRPVGLAAPVAWERDGAMNGPWLQLGLVLVLVLVNAAFAGSEVALISLREAQLQRLQQEGGRGRLVARLARDPNQFLSTIQIGITLAGFLASAAAAITLAEPLVPLLGFWAAPPSWSRSSWSPPCSPTSPWWSGSWRPSGSRCSAPSRGPSGPPGP